MSLSSFFLDPLPPFRLDLTVWALRRRQDNAVDRWDGRTYRRVLALAGGPLELTEIAVVQTGTPEAPRLRATLRGVLLTPERQQAVAAALDRLLGLRVDLAAFYHLASQDAELAPLVQRFRGMKPPRFPSIFESVVNAIACQQITLTLGIHLLNRLAGTCGLPITGAEVSAHAFPRPEDLAHVSAERLRELGFSRQKGRAMIELSQQTAEGLVDLEGLAALPNEEALIRLCRLRGVGRWTAEYALLRGLGRCEVFPGDDVGARNNLQRWLSLTGPLDYPAVHRTLAHWQPYGGLVYFHLLLDRLAAAGCLDAEAPSGAISYGNRPCFS